VKQLVEAALVGLARTGAPAPDLGDAGDSLLARAGDVGAERAFLLRLGVHAVRARAGVMPAAAAERPAAAPPDARPPCPPSLAAIVADLCASRSRPILAEALARIDARGWRLPAPLTPALAALRDASLLPAAANVAGERGRWLAAHNPAWRWLVDGVAPVSLQQRRRVWDEGSEDARTAALRATRLTEPAEARDWIASAWKAEKASLREDMIAALATGLSADDEPLLAQALADRAAGVRQAAARLLARIETSPLAMRARERADAVLAYAAPGAGMMAALKARLAGKSSGELSVSPPDAFVAAWADDGVSEKPPPGTGKRAFWLSQILSFVAPAHWERRFGAGADALVKAAATHDEWADAVLAGWTEAAVRFDARPWAEPLWRARAARQPPESLAGLSALVFPIMDAAAIHEAAVALIDGSEPPVWSGILAAVPRPWSRALADRFLRALTRVFVNGQVAGAHGYAWRAALDIAAPALPIASLDQALAIEPPPQDVPAGSLGAAFEGFRSVLAIRKRIDQETTA
jgi:hypothetical protein